MYRVPMFQDSEYEMQETEDRADRTIRTGWIKGTAKFWREDNLKRRKNKGCSEKERLLSIFYFFPPNIAYDKVPKERTDLFNKALNSFVWGGSP